MNYKMIYQNLEIIRLLKKALTEMKEEKDLHYYRKRNRIREMLREGYREISQIKNEGR